MAYDGKRPIIPGRTSTQVNMVTGEEEESEYSYSEGKNLSGQPLADMPTSGNHVPGEGYYPGDTAMTRRFDGSDPAGPMDPMDDPGKGAELDEYYGIKWPDPVPSADVLDDAGHLPRESEYSGFHPWPHKGVPSASPILDAGHEPRMQEDAPTGGGATAPHEYHGITPQPLADSGNELPEGEEEIYGHFQIMEHKGVPSSKAL